MLARILANANYVFTHTSFPRVLQRSLPHVTHLSLFANDLFYAPFLFSYFQPSICRNLVSLDLRLVPMPLGGLYGLKTLCGADGENQTLQELYLPRCVDDVFVAQVVTSFAALRVLDVSFSRISDRALAALCRSTEYALPRLSELNVAGCAVTNRGMSDLAAPNIALRAASAKASSSAGDFLSDDAHTAADVTKLLLLIKLNCSFTAVGNDGMRSLQQGFGDTLMHLSCCCCGDLTESAIPALLGLQRLKVLNLAHCPKISPTAKQSLYERLGVPNLWSFEAPNVPPSAVAAALKPPVRPAVAQPAPNTTVQPQQLQAPNQQQQQSRPPGVPAVPQQQQTTPEPQVLQTLNEENVRLFQQQMAAQPLSQEQATALYFRMLADQQRKDREVFALLAKSLVQR